MTRTNAAGATTAGLSTDGFTRETIDGVEYLVHDVVAQKEGVYHYPDPEGGMRREYVSGEELGNAIEDVEDVPLVVSHPETEGGNPTLMSDPRANFSEVGMWRDLRRTNDDNGIGGKVYIRLNEVGEHGGELRRYVNRVEQRGVGPVSTGYDIEDAVPDPGRFNGEQYGFEQRGVMLDHLAMLPSEQGDCSIEDGCGLGRANQHDDGPIRVNNHIAGTDDANTQSSIEEMAEVPEGTDPLRTLGRAVAENLGLDRFLDGQTTSAESDTPRSNTMKDEDKIDELVNEYNFDRVNMEPLAGTECLQRIHSAVTEEEQDDGTGRENGEADASLTDTQREEIRSMVPTAEEIADEVEGTAEVNVDEDDLAEKAAEKSEELRAHENRVNRLAESEEYPHIDEERAQRMNEDLVEDLAEELDDASEDESPGRQNFAGRPSGGSFDESQYGGEGGDDYDIPVAGSRGGDDE